MGTTIYKIYNRYDRYKVYVVKETSCHHYYANEMIRGKYFYKRFVRINKSIFNDLMNSGSFIHILKA